MPVACTQLPFPFQSYWNDLHRLRCKRRLPSGARPHRAGAADASELCALRLPHSRDRVAMLGVRCRYPVQVEHPEDSEAATLGASRSRSPADCVRRVYRSVFGPVPRSTADCTGAGRRSRATYTDVGLRSVLALRWLPRYDVFMVPASAEYEVKKKVARPVRGARTHGSPTPLCIRGPGGCPAMIFASIRSHSCHRCSTTAAAFGVLRSSNCRESSRNER